MSKASISCGTPEKILTPCTSVYHDKVLVIPFIKKINRSKVTPSPQWLRPPGHFATCVVVGEIYQFTIPFGVGKHLVSY